MTAIEAVLGDERWDAINGIALWLHGTTDRMQLQRGIVERLPAVIRHRAALFDLCRSVDGRVECFCPVGSHIPDDALAAYYRTYAAQDYTTWSFTPEHPTVYRDLDLIDSTMRDTTPIYRQWMEPLGLYYGMGCTIVEGGVIYGSLTLFNGPDDGDFSDADMRALAEVGRHLGIHFALLWPHGFGAGEDRDALAELARELQITGREEEVLRLMASGATNRSIAKALFISESTVKKHVNAVYRKLGVDNRVQLAQAIYRAGA